MADEPASAYSDEEFTELLGFLSDPKMEVQRFAAEGVLAQTESPHFLEYCRRQPRKAARPLLRLAEKAEAENATSSAAATLAADGAKTSEQAKAARQAAVEAVAASAAGSSALQALVNISTIPTVRDELVELSAPRRTAEAMKGGWLEGRSGLAHWYAMLLANITTAKAGQEALCADETMLRFLLAAFISKPRPPARTGYEDPLIFLGKVIGNVCALEAGRRTLAGGEQGPGTVAAIVNELADRPRRHDVMSALRNLSLDNECHPAVVAADPLPSMARFLYPVDKASAEQRAQLPEALGAALAADGAALTGEAPVRLAGAFCILGLCRTREGREYLRAAGACEVVRAWKQEESEEEVRSVLEAAEPPLTSTEEELEAPQEGGCQGLMADVDEAVDKATGPTWSAPDRPDGSTERPLPKRDEAAEGEGGDMGGLFDHIEGAEDLGKPGR